MSEHTKEPWRIGKSSPYMSAVVSDEKIESIDGADDWDYYGGNMVAESVTPANARRIVACVNACAGFSTEDLENGGIEELYRRHREAARAGANEQIENLARQRDELLEALKGMKHNCEISFHYCETCGRADAQINDDIYSDICRIIEKAEANE